MAQYIILALICIIIGCFYSRWLYKRNGNSFFEETDYDLFSKSQTLQGWFAAVVLIIGGLIFLIKGITDFLK